MPIDSAATINILDTMKTRIIIGIALSIAIAIGLLKAVPPREVWHYLSLAKPHYVALACLANFATLLLRSERWRFLIANFKPLGSWSVMRPYLVGIAVNSVLPFRAGEAVRAYAVAQSGIDKTHSISTVLADRSFDAITFGVLAIVAAQVIELPAPISAHTYSIALSSVALVATFPIVARVSRSMRKREQLGFRSKLERKIAKRLEPLLTGYACLSAGKAFVCGLLSLAAWVIQIAVALLVVRAIGLNLTLDAIIVAILAVNATAAFPLTPANIGVFQVAFMLALAAYGIDRNGAVAAATVLHAVLVIPVTIVGLFLLNRHNYRITFWRQGEKKAS